MAALTMHDLKTYVGGAPERTVAEGTVLLDLTHNYLKNQYVEIPFDINWTVQRCKDKLYTTFGSNPDYMQLTLNGVPMDNDGVLAQYNPKNRSVMHCIDTDPHSSAKGGGLEDVSQVEKYEMSDEDYDKRENTYRAFKKKQLEKDPNWAPKHVLEERARQQAKKDALPAAETMSMVSERMKVGDRCEAIGARRGEIKYIGELEGQKEFVYVGIAFDEPIGKHDGTHKPSGKRYFQTDHNCGAFIISPHVQAGDYPEIDPFASDEEKEDSDEEL